MSQINILFCICIYIIGLNTLFTYGGNIPENQWIGLESFYNSTDGLNWVWSNDTNDGVPWNFTNTSSNPCIDHWQGINCTQCSHSASSECNVIGISLSNHNVSGELPSNLNLINTLQSLDVGYNMSVTLSAYNSANSLITLFSEDYPNHIRGSIPTSLMELTGLRLIDFSNNRLTGTIPTNCEGMTSLVKYNLYVNLLTGGIPTCIGNMRSLEALALGNNPLFGSLPSTIWGSLSSLTAINIVSSFINGTIPSSIYGLTQMQQLSLYSNLLSGTIPEDIGSFVNIFELGLAGNRLEGSIPSTIGQCTALEVLNIYMNRITGNFPSELLLLKNLEVFDFSFNKISGPFPPFYDSNLVEVYGFINNLSGSLPSVIFDNTALKSLSVAFNRMTGTIPSNIAHANQLTYLNVDANQFSGILTDMSFPPLLKYINLNNNTFYGPNPLSSMCNSSMGGLQEIYLGYNKLTGSIPDCVDQLSSLSLLNVEYNRMQGTVPLSMRNLKLLETVILSNNQFRGSLEEAWNSTMLQTVDVSSNRFSGSVPYSLLNMPNTSNSLVSFVMAKNCFTGSISPLICSAQNMQVLDLSGLYASCANPVFEMQNFGVRGSIPDCIFDMRSLVAFYVTGNGLSGTIPSLSVSTNMRVLALDYNRLSGTIPDSVQQWSKMLRLTLSSNRLKGTVTDMTNYSLDGELYEVNGSDIGQYRYITVAPAPCRLEMKNNRLTGNIPASFTNTKCSITMLEGNMFQCASLSTLPQTDPEAHSSLCGSTELNVVMYVFAAVMGCILMACSIYMLTDRFFSLKNRFYEHVFELFEKSKVYLLSNVDAGAQCGDVNVNRTHTFLNSFRKQCLSVVLVINIFLLPSYVILKLVNGGIYGTHTYQYGWLYSFSFVGGVPAGIVVFMLWMSILIFVMKSREWLVSYYGSEGDVGEETIEACDSVPGAYHRVWSWNPLTNPLLRKQALFLLVNSIIVLTINSVYVMVQFGHLGPVEYFLFLIVGVIKMSWNSLVIYPWLKRLEFSTNVQTMVLLANLVLAPFVASAFVDVSCFQGVIIPAEPISTDYLLSACTLYLFNGECALHKNRLHSVSFTPPFIYSNQCIGAVMVNFIPVYVAMFGVLNPLKSIIQICITVYYGSVYDGLMIQIDRERQTSGSNSVTIAPELVDPVNSDTEVGALSSANPHSLSILSAASWKHTNPSHTSSLIKMLSIKKYSTWYQRYTLGILEPSVLPIDEPSELLAYRSSEELNSDMYLLDLYNCRSLGLNCMVQYCIMIIFGMAYPFLAIVLVANITLATLRHQLSMHYHYTQIKFHAKYSDVFMHQWEHIVLYETSILIRLLRFNRLYAIEISVALCLLFVMEIVVSNYVLYGYGLISFLLIAVTSYIYVQSISKPCDNEYKSKAAGKLSGWEIDSDDSGNVALSITRNPIA